LAASWLSSPPRGLSPVTLQPEKVFELPDHPLDDLPFPGRPPAYPLRPGTPRVHWRGSRHQRAVLLKAPALPLQRREALIGQEGMVPVGTDKELPDGALVAVGRCQPEGDDDALRVHREGYLEAADPLGWLNGPLPVGIKRRLRTHYL
jgi:hypothetical protein